MELVAIGTYREAAFELWPGDDTLELAFLDDERKASILADFPEKVQEITDIEQYKVEKAARLAARAAEREAAAAQEDKPYDPFNSQAMTSADAFSNAPDAKDLSPYRKDTGLEIETQEAKLTKGKRK